MSKIIDIIDETIKTLHEGVLEIPEIPNTMNFWHGGNLDRYSNDLSQKIGRYEYGAGLYLTTHYETAHKYAKGSRRLYLVTVAIGNEINDVFIDYNKLVDFIKRFVIGSKRKEIIERMNSHNNDGKVNASIFNNIVLNWNAISSTNTKYLRNFLIENGIDYELVDNPFGWGETMMVLYNMDKIVSAVVVKPTDKIEKFDLK